MQINLWLVATAYTPFAFFSMNMHSKLHLTHIHTHFFFFSVENQPLTLPAALHSGRLN